MYIQRRRSKNSLSSWTTPIRPWNNQHPEILKEASCNLRLYSYEYH